jgi:hypothetical protein
LSNDLRFGIEISNTYRHENCRTLDKTVEVQRILVLTPRHQDCGKPKEDFSRDSLLVTSRGVTGGVSGMTGYLPTFFESK